MPGRPFSVNVIAHMKTPEGAPPTPPEQGGRKIATYCYQCINGPDLLTVEVRDGVATAVEPNFGVRGLHPADGKICVKPYGLVQKLYNPNRILKPLKRTNPRKGRDEDPGWVEIGWDEALDLLAAKLRPLREHPRDEHGHPRLAFTIGGAGTPLRYMGSFPAFLRAWGPVDQSLVADLERCVGCQTCTAACRHANATSPAVQWRRVLDIEAGRYPEVSRTFVPVGCQHCADPPCMHVCPTTATRQRADGIVTVDYDLCIGCAYCDVACPYQARFKISEPGFAYGAPMANEAAREDARRLGVSQKCTFCSDRIDFGLANGLVPGADPRATPACVNSCIAGALAFGDVEDPASPVSELLARTEHFRMHEELGTEPGFYYVTDDK